MKTYDTNKVFTPTSPAKDSFVERIGKINSQFVDALHTPGKQIVLYGHSGCGKTTLLVNKLAQTYESYYITRCMEGMTFESILLDGFDQLSAVYSDTSKSKSISIAPEIKIGYAEIQASLKLGSYSSESSTQIKGILPPQLTPQRLAMYFGKSNSCWILEDFHKIKGKEKTRTSQLMKVFMDMSDDYPDLKIIALGAVGTARQVVEYDREMNNRVSEIFVPYMRPHELESIINRGEELLNLLFSKDVKAKIVRYSCGLPSICHQLCLNICFKKNVRQTAVKRISVNLDDLEDAMTRYVEERSDTFKAEFDKAIKISNKEIRNVPKSILSACVLLNKEEFSYDDIFSLRKNISEAEFGKFLGELCSQKRSEILVHDENSNLYRFNNLFLKSYAIYRLKAEIENEELAKTTRRSHDSKVIAKLLDIIESDVYNNIDDDTDHYLDEEI